MTSSCIIIMSGCEKTFEVFLINADSDSFPQEDMFSLIAKNMFCTT